MPKALLITLALLLTLPAYAAPHLVDTAWLMANLDSPKVAVVDMSDSMQYSRFHIPGARHLPYEAINQRDRRQISRSIGSNRLIKLLEQLGIRSDMHIVIYDDIGGLNGSRLFWELERLGHQEVSLLDGGLVAWILEGKKVVAQYTRHPKARYVPGSTGARVNLADLGDITDATQDKTILLDVRSKEEYVGHPRQRRSGHIPGAQWWNWEDNIDFANQFKARPDTELMKQARQVGLMDKKQPVIVYCQSGHRAAQGYFTLRRLGFENVRLYDASMAEYGQTPSHMVKQGERP